MPHLPLLPFERIAKNAKVARISKDALEEARDIIEEVAVDIVERAVALSKHANRRTVQEEDIRFVTS